MGARQTQCKRNELWRAPMLLCMHEPITRCPQAIRTLHAAASTGPDKKAARNGHKFFILN